MIAWRIVEIKNNKPHSLFHGTNKSREIKLDQWNKANIKMVQDGSGQQKKKYLSGWHVLETEEQASQFFEKMFRIKTNRRIIKCKVRGNIRPKHSDGRGQPCILADEIYISSRDLSLE